MANKLILSWRALTDRQRKYTRRSGIGVAITLVVLALLIFVLPSPTARWVITSELNKLGVQHDGIGTIDIDLWNSEVRAGPIEFRANAARDGEIGNVGFEYSLGAVFSGRAFLQSFIIEGVDLFIRRGNDGVISINGVSLQPAGENATAAPEEPDQEPGFGFGVEQFEFTNSTLVFEDVSGGTLAVEVESLSVERLFSWTTEEPARFALEGSANDIALSLTGTIVPFGDPLRVKVDADIDGITIDRVSRFIGPTGLSRQDGTLNTKTHYEYAIYADGRVDGKMRGTFQVSDVLIATQTEETGAIDEVNLQLDIRKQLQADGAIVMQGDLKVDAATIALATGIGDGVDIRSLTLNIADVALDKSKEPRETLFTYEKASVETLSPAGQAISLIPLAINSLRNLAIDILSHQLTVDGKPQMQLNEVRVVTATRDDVPGQTLTFDALALDLGTLTSEMRDAGLMGQLGLDATINALSLKTGENEANADIESVRLVSPSVDLSASREETSLALDLAATFDELQIENHDGIQGSLNRFSFNGEGFRLARADAEDRASGSIVAMLEGLALTLPDEGSETTVRGETAEISLAPLSLSAGASPTARFAGNVSLDAISVESDADQPLSVSLARHQTRFVDMVVGTDGDATTIAGDVASDLVELAISAGADQNKLGLNIRGISNKLVGLTGSVLGPEAPSLSSNNHLRIDQLKAEFPVSDTEHGVAVLDAFEADLSSIEIADSHAVVRGALQAQELSVSTQGESQSQVDISSISLAGLDVDTASAIGVGDLVVDGLDARLALTPRRDNALETTEASVPPEPAAEPTVSGLSETKSSVLVEAPSQPIRVDRFSISPGARIAIVDENFSPAFESIIGIERLELGPVDTSAPGTQTQIDFAATVNEAAPVSMNGWVSAFGTDPKINARGRVEALNLPFLSAFVAQATGVNIESGDLTTDFRAATGENGLDGQIDLLVDDLFVVPISEEEAKRLQATVGVPVGFAVSVLKDGNGVINLGFPVSGSLTDPQIDYSEAINKAISGALASLFPLNWFGSDGNSFSMQPVRFAPATVEMTDDGQAVAREIGTLIATKDDIRVRVCGRASRDDLLALRLSPDLTADSLELRGGSSNTSGDGVSLPKPEIAEPTEAEIASLIELATSRGNAVRIFLGQEFGIDSQRLPQCRTAYSIEDEKAPRAELQF